MCTVTYIEPHYILAGRCICEAFTENNAGGNLVSILSDAQRCTRQRGPAGLVEWIKVDHTKRNFIIDGLKKSTLQISGEIADYNIAWSLTEKLINAFGYAKQQAKGQE